MSLWKSSVVPRVCLQKRGCAHKHAVQDCHVYGLVKAEREVEISFGCVRSENQVLSIPPYS